MTDDKQMVLEMRHRQCVEELFDDYADEFDQHLVQGLRYDIPNVLLEKVRASGHGSFERGLDLGCGTGLAGQTFRASCKYLEGVDLSQRMVDKAEERGLYDSLHVRDLVAHLRRQEAGSFDLLVSADVLIYVYNMQALFTEAARVLRSGGLFAFSTESAGEDEGEVVERTSERFAHSREYILRLAAGCFALESVDETTIRMDGSDGEILGDVFVLRRVGDPQEAAVGK